ncbi:MAG: hypothetical protein CVV27_03125 [Candidatus Melainabacteria bacterium HGW-Melainabacteria-1]|nr:MAG: hypothetical protein CVV27_03125 [Candidatus Melainabacteria bacterium HGW-Melainabacteria-1]
MSRLYSAFVLLLSAVLLLIFHAGGLGGFWNSDVKASGNYYQESFFRQRAPQATQPLTALGGRRLVSDSQRVIYQFAVPQQTEVYVRPTLAKQSGLQDQQQKSISYKNLKSLQLKLPQTGKVQTLFKVSNQISQRIRLTPYLQDAAIFELVLDNSGQTADSERVIGSLEIFMVSQPANDALPKLPLLMLFWILPLLWSWLCNCVLGIPLASSLGLALSGTLGTHILWLLKPELIDTLLPASAGAALLLLGLHTWLERRPLPSAPFFWGILWLAVQLRWQEILIQATQALDHLPPALNYYNHALLMDLFSPKGFFAAIFPQGPLYPFVIKLTGFVFGFSHFHMFYISLAGGLLLLVLAYRLARLLLLSQLQALLVMALLALNPQLIQESGLRSPDILSAALGLTLLLLVFSPLQHPWVRGLLRGMLLMLLIWNHLSFLPLALLLLGLDLVYQVRRSQPTSSWRQSLNSGLLSGLIVLLGFLPCLVQNYRVYGSYLPESTAYVTRVANLEFSDQPGFPASLDVIRLGEKAPHYRELGIREYFFDYHNPAELLAGNALGFVMLGLDSMGALVSLTSGENILGVLIHGLSGRQNLLPILLRFGLELFGLLFLITFAWIRFRRYRFLLTLLALLMLPHAFFYGIFMLKGFSHQQSLLDQQVFLFSLPLLAIMLIDALAWTRQQRGRWLR